MSGLNDPHGGGDDPFNKVLSEEFLYSPPIKCD